MPIVRQSLRFNSLAPAVAHDAASALIMSSKPPRSGHTPLKMTALCLFHKHHAMSMIAEEVPFWAAAGAVRTVVSHQSTNLAPIEGIAAVE